MKGADDESRFLVSALGNFNSVSSALLSTGILFSQGESRANIDWIKQFTSRTTIPVNHLGSPNFAATSIEVIENAEWIFNSGQLSTLDT